MKLELGKMEWIELHLLRVTEGNLRKRERQLSKQIEKLGMDFLSTLRRREKVVNRRETLERSMTKVTELKKRGARVGNRENGRDNPYARAIELMLAGKVDEAMKLRESLKSRNAS